MNPRSFLARACAAALVLAAPSLPAAYKEAQVTRLEKDVKVLKENAAPHAAAVGEKINAVTSVATGPASRAELMFPDKSLTRLGANSRFTIRGDKHTLDLDKGVLLLQVPERLRDAKVRTAAVTAAVTGGSILFESLPGGFVKVICVEGNVDLSMNANPKDYVSLSPGQMIVMPWDASAIPRPPVDIDLKRLLETSGLLKENDDSPNAGLVQDAVNQQQEQIQDGDLVKTNLVIPGLGTIVQLNNDTRLNLFRNITIQDSTPGGQSGATGPAATGGTGTAAAGANVAVSTTPPFPGFVPLIADTTILNANSIIKTDPQVTAVNVGAQGIITSEGLVYRTQELDGPFPYFAFGSFDITDPDLQPLIDNAGEPWAVYKFERLLINGTPDFVIAGGVGEASNYFEELPPVVETYIPNVILAALGKITLAEDNPFSTGEADPGNPTGNKLKTKYTDLESLVLYSQNGDIELAAGFKIKASYQDISLVTAGLTSNITLSGDIDIYHGNLLVSAGQDLYAGSNVYASDIVFRAGRDVTVDGTGEAGTYIVQANDAKLLVSAKRNIHITNSAQLVALADLSDEDMLRLESIEGDIVIDNNSQIRGTNVEIEAFNGNLSVVDSLITATHALKMQALRPNGELFISGSTLTAGGVEGDARDFMRLYAAASGSVRFAGNVTLDSDEVQIAAGKVQVDAGGIVTISKNLAHIFADTHNWNKNGDGSAPGFGTINGAHINRYEGFNHASKPAFKGGGKLGGRPAVGAP